MKAENVYSDNFSKRIWIFYHVLRRCTGFKQSTEAKSNG